MSNVAGACCRGSGDLLLLTRWHPAASAHTDEEWAWGVRRGEGVATIGRRGD